MRAALRGRAGPGGGGGGPACRLPPLPRAGNTHRALQSAGTLSALRRPSPRLTSHMACLMLTALQALPWAAHHWGLPLPSKPKAAHFIVPSLKQI